MSPKISLLLLFTFLAMRVFAQKKVTILRDTIDLRGYVYNENGEPLKDATIVTANYTAKTDDHGYFTLKGIWFSDTLGVRSWYGVKTVINNGSRFLIIKVPADVSTTGTIEIRATRKHPHFTPSIKKEFINGCFLVIEQEASFPGGAERFKNYINSHISYPQRAIDHNIEGEVEVSFTIDRNRSVINPIVIRGLGYGCEDAIIEAIKRSPKWSPGISGGQPMVCRSSVTINFKLTDKN